MRNFIFLGLFLVVIGLFFKQELAVGLGWVLLAACLLSLLWQWRVLRAIKVRREMADHAFLDDLVPVKLTVSNSSRLPLPWLTLREAIPADLPLAPDSSRPNWLLNLRSREQSHFSYTLWCKTRGRYTVGPAEGAAGVILEPGNDPVGERLSWPELNHLTVYPQIVPLEQLGLPSRLPLGNLKTRQPLLSDPSRIAGIRDYQPGDDPRHIDWRSSARLNTLQIKQFERSRQMPLAILLDMKLLDYQYARRIDSEVSIVVAASLANRANQLRQPFGLYSNGFDPFFRSYQELLQIIATEPGPAIGPRQGDAHLTHILDKLAGLQARQEAPPLESLISHWTSGLAWGATVVIVALEPTQGIVGEMLRLRKGGYSPVGIFTGQSAMYRATRQYHPAQLRDLGLTVFEVSRASDLNVILH